MRYGNFDEKSKDHYTVAFGIEIQQKMKFYQADVQNHNKNISRLEGQIREEEAARGQAMAEIAGLEAKLADPDGAAKRLLFLDFKAAIAGILSGPESQQNNRYGLKISNSGPYVVEKPVSVSRDGKRVTEVRTVAVTKHKSNEQALEVFRSYLRTGYSLPSENLTFEELRAAICKFFENAPKPDVYGEMFETETAVSDSNKGAAAFFRM